MKTFIFILRDKKHIEIRANSIHSAILDLPDKYSEDDISSITILDF